MNCSLLPFPYYSRTEVLIKPRNQTVLVREKAVFFCQVQGVQGEIRLNGTTISENPMRRLPDVDVDFVHLPTQHDELGITNITLTINASVERNNSEILCTDHLIGIAGGSSAYLIVIGMGVRKQCRLLYMVHMCNFFQEDLINQRWSIVLIERGKRLT